MEENRRVFLQVWETTVRQMLTVRFTPPTMKKIPLLVLTASLALLLAGCGQKKTDDKIVLQVGHFPNITHAQALVAHQLSRQGKGWFEERLGPNVKIEWRVFNAGPSAMESLFANAVDITYVGPNPAINAYARSGGEEVRIVAGSADGGASLVVNPKLGLTKPEDFKGKRIGTPQFANTQDVACRAWLIKNGIHVTATGGDASVIPTANPDQLALFQGGKLDAVWTVEPWVSRLLREADGKIFLEQKDTVTTVLVSGVKLMKNHPDLVRKFVAAHDELTQWINAHPTEAQGLALKELQDLTHGKIDPGLISEAWGRIIFTPKLNRVSLEDFVDQAHACGFLKERLNIDRLDATAHP